MEIVMQVKIYDELPLEAKKIREDVFVKEQGFSEEFDLIDKTAKHILIFEDNMPVATCRIFYSNERDCYLIGRIAVIKQYRGKKYGARLLEYAEREIKKDGGTSAELSAQCRVSEFYKKLGYMDLKDIHVEQGCPHTWMRKILN